MNRTGLNDSRMNRTDLVRCVWLALLALVYRLIWIFFKPWVAGDSYDYLTIARNIRFHQAFSLNGSGVGPFPPAAYRAPLYPALMALLWIGDSPPVWVVLILQALIGAITVACVYLAARDHFDRKVATMGTIFMLAAPMTCHFTAVILTETLFTFLLVLAVLFWGRQRAVLAGITLGLAALTRPIMLPFLFVMPVLLLLPSRRASWRKHLLIVLIATVISATWIIRNAIVFHHFIAIQTSSWGANFLCGTLDTELVGIKIWTGNEWAVDINAVPLLQVDPSVSESEAERIRLSRALIRIKERPFHWLVVRAEQYPKLFLDSGDYVLGRYNLSIGDALSRRNYAVVLFKAAFIGGNLIALVLAGWGLFSVRKRWPELIHLLAFPVFLLLVQIPMWTEARFSIPIVPMIGIFAAVAIQSMLSSTSVHSRLTRRPMLLSDQDSAASRGSRQEDDLADVFS